MTKKVDVTTLGDTVRTVVVVNDEIPSGLRPYQRELIEAAPKGEIMLHSRNFGKTMTIRHKEQLIAQGADAGSDEVVMTYTIDEADDLLEAMALTMGGMDVYNDNVADGDKWHDIEGRIIDYYKQPAPQMMDWKTLAERRIPIDEYPETDSSIWKWSKNLGTGRGPKGGAANRLAKRRAKNKAARKARRHG